MKTLILLAVTAVLAGCMTSNYRAAELCDGTELTILTVPIWRQEECVNVNHSDGETPSLPESPQQHQ